MASTRILITPASTNLSSALLNGINQLADARTRLSRLAAYAERAAVDNDWAAVAAEFGVSQAQAEGLYNLLVGTVATLNAAGDLDNLIDRTGTI